MNDEKQLSSLVIDDTVYESHLTKKFMTRKRYMPSDPNKLYAFIPGIIRSVSVHNGTTVKEGDELLVLEAMKMMNTIKSHLNGHVLKVHVREGEMVTKGQLLLELE